MELLAYRLTQKLDVNKPADMISDKKAATLFFYSCLFMRFAWMVLDRLLCVYELDRAMRVSLAGSEIPQSKANGASEIPEAPQGISRKD